MTDIKALAQAWLSNMNDLLALLDEEFQSLKTRSMDSILACSQKKNSLAESIDAIEKQLLSKLDIDPTQSSAALTALLSEVSQTENTMDIKQLAKSVQQANLRNGVLLQSMIRLNEHGLNILSGRQDSASTYTASGQITNKSSLTRLATA